MLVLGCSCVECGCVSVVVVNSFPFLHHATKEKYSILWSIVGDVARKRFGICIFIRFGCLLLTAQTNKKKKKKRTMTVDCAIDTFHSPAPNWSCKHFKSCPTQRITIRTHTRTAHQGSRQKTPFT